MSIWTFNNTHTGNSGTIQIWTVPMSGVYRITVLGAQGASAQSGHIGGRGARMSGDFSFSRGQQLHILVGQQGTSDGCSGGGGGGSFVVLSGAPLIIAAGGGGTRRDVHQDGCAGRITTFAGTGSGSATTHTCAFKTTNEGFGGVVSSSTWGSGAGGFFGAGSSDSAGGGGQSWANGATGGGGAAMGGYGGGGSGNGSCGGGGGGGFSGGDGGLIAGGGGSYNIGANQDNESGVRNGHGLVTIELLSKIGTFNQLIHPAVYTSNTIQNTYRGWSV